LRFRIFVVQQNSNLLTHSFSPSAIFASMKYFLVAIFLLIAFFSFSQTFNQSNVAAQHWADSVLARLSHKQKITQLMVLRESETKNGIVNIYSDEIDHDIRKHNIGGISLFQGNPTEQANFINHFQQISKIPMMICIDAETGLGMRMYDSVAKMPDQLTLGATNDTALIYEIGKAIGAQCRREGINVNYAPVVDINNNPNNPIINYRSFGEDKYKVASLATQMMRGLQSEDVMACAKHFPGHGDVNIDSHLDLPVIYKSMTQLDSLELYPFKKIFSAGVGSVMIAHLSIPAIDTTAHLPTSLSQKNVTGLLRNELGYQGISFTDALDMKGVARYFPDGEAAAQSLIAGNDMLCLPTNIPSCIKAVKKAVRAKKLSWNDIDKKVKKVLVAKYELGLNDVKQENTQNLTQDLNSGVNSLRQRVAEEAITLLKLQNTDLLSLNKNKKIAFVGIGIDSANTFSSLLKSNFNGDYFYFSFKENANDEANILHQIQQNNYDEIIIGLHNFNKYPANNFGISDAALDLLNHLQKINSSITFVFGNPYVIKNFCNAPNLVECYEDDSIFQTAAFNLLTGVAAAKGTLPVTVCKAFHYGDGIKTLK
jgi:beta-N-acetylhexosaminidase